MRERLKIFYYLIIYWLSFMILGRIVFMVYNLDLTAALSWKERFLSVVHGMVMDASISGYFMLLSGIMLFISVFLNARKIAHGLTFLTIALVVLCSLIITVDLELYHHWGFRMNTTPLLYAGKEAVGSVSVLVIAKLLLVFVFLSTVSCWVFIRKIRPLILDTRPARPATAFVLLGFTVLMIIPIRGSFTVAPMNTGFVYYHNRKPYANHVAVNVVWNFLYSLTKSSDDYPENFFDHYQTENLFSALYRNSNQTTPVLSTREPNIILIILESFTANVVAPLGGRADLTPTLNQLSREGILFDSVYSSGDRTDKGIISILSAYPAQPHSSIIKLPGKTQKLPQLTQKLKDLNYRTSFIYGGDIDFANFRSYLNIGGFDHLTSLDDFDDELYTSKWGVHDHFMFERAMQELDTTREKFFKVILTLSSHEPFDVPMPPYITGSDEESLFLNSCYYADQSLGKFIEYCKAKPWWKNTLLVITADHGHRFPGNKSVHEKEKFRIPLILAGGAVATDTTIHTVGSQTDIANTILAQIDRPHADFIFSKDLLAPDVKPFASYFYNDGYGFIMPGKYIVFDNASQKFLIQKNATTHDLDLSKAYEQKLYSHYNHLDKK